MKNYITFFTLLVTAILLSTFSFIDYAVTAMMMVTLVLYLIYSNNSSRGVIKFSFSSLMLVYLAWLLIVAFLSPVPHASKGNLVMLVGLPLLYLCATNFQAYSDAWMRQRYILMFFGVVLSVWGIWQVINHIGLGIATGPLNDRNAFAASLNLLWFPVVYLFAVSTYKSDNRWAMIISGFSVFVIGLGLFATTSRGAILTWGLLLPILLWSCYKYTKSKLIVGYVLALSFIAYLCSSYFLDSSIADRTFVLAQDPSSHARIQLWQSTLNMALDHPLLGTGWGTFAYYYPAYRLPIEKTTAGFFAHNDYLQFASEGGLIAIVLLILVLVGVLWKIKEYFNRSDITSFESVSLLLGVLALFVHAAVNFIFYFAFMSCVAGLYLARVSTITEVQRSLVFPELSQIRSSVKKLVLYIVLFFISIPYIIQLLAQLCLTGTNPGLRAIQIVFPQTTAFNVANIISSIYPSNGIAQEYILRTYEYYLLSDSNSLSPEAKQGLLQNAIKDIDALRKINANHPSIGSREVKLILAADSHGDYTRSAYRIIEDNLKADPFDGVSMMLLARLQAKDGRREDAITTLDNAYHKVIKRRDQLLILVEYLRQLAYPKIYPDLDNIEKQLLLIKIDAETGRVDIESTDIYERIINRLDEIKLELEKSKVS